jgi:hypothetical protein
VNAERYSALRDFLLPWEPLWGHSILRSFAEMERWVPEEWLEYGATRELAFQFALGQGGGDDQAPPSLLSWVRQIRGLCDLPRLEVSHEIRPPYERGLTPKKKHELEAVVTFFRRNDIAATRILDIGGGVGYLARHLSASLGCPIESIDLDPVLQRRGCAEQERFPWKRALKHPVRFITGRFPEKAFSMDEGSWAIGLHTCGDLAWSQIELVGKGMSVLNVGCCYEKLMLGKEVLRSRHVRSRPIALTEEALFLAGRGGVERSPEEFLFQQRVQRYRFALHLLIARDSAGTARDEIYRGSFSDYARDRSPDCSESEAALEAHYRSVEALVEKQRFVAFLRSLLARPLELAILLDRALFLEEQGVKAELIELFNPRISPRNVGLVASQCESFATNSS